MEILHIRICLLVFFFTLSLYGFSQQEFDLSQDWKCCDSSSTIVFEREFTISKQMSRYDFFFVIEHITSSCKLFIDNKELSQIEKGSLCYSPKFHCQKHLKKGVHKLKIEIMSNTECVSIWQGFWDRVYMTPNSPVDNVVVSQNSDNKTINIQGLQISTKKRKHTIFKFDGNNIIPFKTNNTYYFKYDTINRWDEYYPKLNSFEINHQKGKYIRKIGLLELSRNNGILEQNGKRLFLRALSYNNVCLSDHKLPSSEDEWKQIMAQLKSRGFNALFFDDLIPIEVVFRSADKIGFYIICPTNVNSEMFHPSCISPSIIEKYRIDLRQIPVDETSKDLLENIMCNKFADGFILQSNKINIENFSIIPIVKCTQTKLKNSENFNGEIMIANYSMENLTGFRINWRAENSEGDVISDGSFGGKLIKPNTVNNIERIFFPIGNAQKGEVITLKILIEGKNIENRWNLKVY